MLTDGSLSPLCHLTGQHSERLFLLFFSAGVGQLLPWPPPPWKRLKAILRPNVLEICLGLARACRDGAGCTLLLFFLSLPSFSRPVEARSAGCSRCRLGLHPPQDPGALTPGKTWIGWMGRTGDGLGSVLVVGLEYVGVLEQLSKWSNNLSGISLAVSPVSPPPLPPTYLTPDYAFPGLVLPQTFHTPQVRSAACAARSIQCGPLADDVKHGLHPATSSCHWISA